MAVCKLPKLETGVRFPSLAPACYCGGRASLRRGSDSPHPLQDLTFGQNADFLMGGAQRRPLILFLCWRKEEPLPTLPLGRGEIPPPRPLLPPRPRANGKIFRRRFQKRYYFSNCFVKIPLKFVFPYPQYFPSSSSQLRPVFRVAPDITFNFNSP